MFMGVAKCPGGVDGSLVGVEDYLGFLLLFFACQAIQLVQAMGGDTLCSCCATGQRFYPVSDNFSVAG